MPFTRILVPVDFSAQSNEAVAMAVELAKRDEATLALAHVFQPISYALPEGYVLYNAKQLADVQTAIGEQLDALKKRAESYGAPSVVTTQVQGVPAQEILVLAQAGAFDLIVMSTHGRSGIPHLLIGSVAERVIRHAPCPVLTLRRSAKTS
jgi:universal stress protein A